MPDHLRVLSRSAGIVPVAQLQRRLKRDGLSAVVEIPQGRGSSWGQLLFKHRQGSQIARLDRKPNQVGERGAEELAALRREVGSYQPASAARWLQEYLGQVQCLYGFELLAGAEETGGLEAIHAVQWEIWTTLGGILQAEGEGFSNEDGYHVLWQFPDDVSGTWNMAVLDGTGRWVAFEMDLGNPEHRRAFLAGAIPSGARRL